ncbi:hypothetical protein IFM89_023554 [Coptis chinensis]|uniref:Uncharacterized protein n=1 Tax=Coptis chinensis TaxID=261450 RepID=A0A835IGT2_9MAGN|nr:hypothetical protein IFM89_023554 [Coptis chinensis]
MESSLQLKPSTVGKKDSKVWWAKFVWLVFILPQNGALAWKLIYSALPGFKVLSLQKEEYTTEHLLCHSEYTTNKVGAPQDQVQRTHRFILTPRVRVARLEEWREALIQNKFDRLEEATSRFMEAMVELLQPKPRSVGGASIGQRKTLVVVDDNKEKEGIYEVIVSCLERDNKRNQQQAQSGGSIDPFLTNFEKAFACSQKTLQRILHVF